MSGRIKPEFMALPSLGHDDDEEFADTMTALIQRTGEWARIFTGDSRQTGRLAERIRASRGGWRGHYWEAAVRKDGRGEEAQIYVYARHIRPLGAATDDTPNDEGDEH